jgi:hypothetical protein
MAPRNATRSRPKDAIAMLHADHQKVRQLFRAYRTAKDQTTQWELALHIFDGARSQGRICGFAVRAGKRSPLCFLQCQGLLTPWIRTPFPLFQLLIFLP